MKIVDYIIKSLKESPKSWKRDKYTLWKADGLEYRHGADCLVIWVSNGFWFYGVYKPEEICFTFWDKIRFYLVFKWWLHNFWKEEYAKDTESAEKTIISKYFDGVNNGETKELERMYKLPYKNNNR